MRAFLTLWRRELTSTFLSPIAYVTLVVFLAVSGGTFMMGVFNNAGRSQPLSNLLFASIILWMTLLISVVSMRLFAEEKRTGTLETLMTAPVTETQVVLGKYAGALAFLLIVAAPAVGQVGVLAYLSPGITLETLDLGALAGGCAILVLVIGFFTAIGLLVSLMTRNQIVAAVCTFCAVWLALLAGHILSAIPAGTGRIPDYLSVVGHIEDFSRGQLDTRPVVLYVTGTALLLYASVRVLESRRWK